MTALRLIGRPWKASNVFVLVLPVLFVVGLVIGYYAKAAVGGEQAAESAEGYPFPPIRRALFGNSRKIAENRAVRELERSMGQSPLFVNNMGWTTCIDMVCLRTWTIRLRRT